MVGNSRRMVYLSIGPRVVELATQVEDPKAICIPFAAPTNPTEWIEALASLEDQLREVVESLKLQGAPATVFYRSPKLSCQHHTAPTKKRKEAIESARLSSIGASPYSFDEVVVDAICAARDRDGELSRFHVCAAYDRVDAADAVAELVERIGLRVHRLNTLEAEVLTDLIDRATKTSDEVVGYFYLGHDRSCLVVGDSSTIKLVRQITVGVEQLVDAIASVRVSDSNDEPLFTRKQAEQILAKHGVPGRDDVIDEERDIQGWRVLPLLQPVLQRLMVEVKQTLRFSLKAEQRMRLSIQMMGPGGATGGIDRLFAESLESKVTVDEESKRYRRDSVAGPATEFAIGIRRAASGEGLNLMSRTTVAKDLKRRSQSAMMVGAVAALVLVVVGFAGLKFENARIQSALESTERTVDDVEAIRTLRTQVLGANAALVDFENRVNAMVDGQPDWSGAIAEIARLVPDEVRLTQVVARAAFSQDETPSITVEGYCFITGDGDPLRDCVDLLKESPYFDKVMRGAVGRSMFDGRPAQRFDLHLTPRIFNREDLRELAASMTGERP